MRSQQATDPPHNNSFCEDQPENWGKIPECPIPQFAGGFPQVKVVTFTITQAYDRFIWALTDFNLLNPVLQTWMWVIGPMIIYLCERLLRFIRYMQHVSYRKVSLHRLCCSSEPQYSCSVLTNCFHSYILDCNPPIQGVGTTAGEAWIQDGSWSVCVPQLSSHLSAGVASIYHDLSPGRGLL